MKKPINLNFAFDASTIIKALILMNEDVPTETEIENEYFGGEVKTIDCEQMAPSDKMQLCVMLMALKKSK